MAKRRRGRRSRALESSLGAPPEVDFHSLIDRDDSAARQVLAAAKEAGVMRVSGGGEKMAGEARAVIEAGREVFATPADEKMKRELGEQWFGRRNGGEEFYWHLFRSPETERLLQRTWPDSYLDLRDKMDTVSLSLQIVADSIAKILSEHFKNQIPSNRIEKIQSILCLRKCESYRSQSSSREWSDPKSDSDALNLHVSGDDHEFSIHCHPQGSAIFMMPAGDILVTFGKPLQEWSYGALKSASADALHQPTDDQFVSFSLEYMCSPLISSYDPDNGIENVTFMDRLLLVLVFAALIILWRLLFSLFMNT